MSDWGPTNPTAASEANIDSVAPPTPTVTPMGGCPAGTNTVNAYSDDGVDGSGAAYYNYKINGGATKRTLTQLGSVDIHASGTITFQAVDFTGLTSGWSSPATPVCVS